MNQCPVREKATISSLDPRRVNIPIKSRTVEICTNLSRFSVGQLFGVFLLQNTSHLSFVTYLRELSRLKHSETDVLLSRDLGRHVQDMFLFKEEDEAREHRHFGAHAPKMARAPRFAHLEANALKGEGA
jgi:hypothetical protein